MGLVVVIPTWKSLFVLNVYNSCSNYSKPRRLGLVNLKSVKVFQSIVRVNRFSFKMKSLENQNAKLFSFSIQFQFLVKFVSSSFLKTNNK